MKHSETPVETYLALAGKNNLFSLKQKKVFFIVSLSGLLALQTALDYIENITFDSSDALTL